MSTCPICKKENRDILKHLRISHDITEPEQYQIQLERMQRTEQRRKAFSDFVGQLKERIQSGSISAEQYRESVEKWLRENEE